MYTDLCCSRLTRVILQEDVVDPAADPLPTIDSLGNPHVANLDRCPDARLFALCRFDQTRRTSRRLPGILRTSDFW